MPSGHRKKKLLRRAGLRKADLLPDAPRIEVRPDMFPALAGCVFSSFLYANFMMCVISVGGRITAWKIHTETGFPVPDCVAGCEELVRRGFLVKVVDPLENPNRMATAVAVYECARRLVLESGSCKTPCRRGRRSMPVVATSTALTTWVRANAGISISHA